MIKVYAIKSILSKDSKKVEDDSLNLIKELENELKEEFILVDDVKRLDNFSLILVQTGGSERFFKRDIYPYFNGPYYLLTYGSNNSLAASLEILSFIKNEGKRGEVLHGSVSYIAKRIEDFRNSSNSNTYRLGVFGIPSDWLISSDVNYKKCLDTFNISLIDVNQEEIIEELKKYHEECPKELFDTTFNKVELNKAYNIYLGLKAIVDKYNLNGFTIRCFDIIKALNTSSCLALSMFNDEGITATCEGDIPSLITMFILQNIFHSQSFQANPNWIDPEKNEITLAHCTLPLKMTKGYTFDTHFESGIGLGIHGELDLSDVTIVKISSNLELFYVEEGAIIKNEYRQDRCRTQIVIRLNGDAAYFLTSSLGNHHLVIYGKRKKEIQVYLRSLGLREVI